MFGIGVALLLLVVGVGIWGIIHGGKRGGYPYVRMVHGRQLTIWSKRDLESWEVDEMADILTHHLAVCDIEQDMVITEEEILDMELARFVEEDIYEEAGPEIRTPTEAVMACQEQQEENKEPVFAIKQEEGFIAEPKSPEQIEAERYAERLLRERELYVIHQHREESLSQVAAAQETFTASAVDAAEPVVEDRREPEQCPSWSESSSDSSYDSSSCDSSYDSSDSSSSYDSDSSGSDSSGSSD